MRPFTLVTSDDPLLLQRGVDRVLRDLDDHVTVDRTDVEEEGLPDVRTGSLFGDETVHVLRFARVPSGGILDELTSLAASPGDTPVVVAVRHANALPKTLQGLADAAGGGDAHVAVTTPPDWADEQWDRLVGEEFRLRGRHADAGAIAAVRRHAGLDPSMVAVQVATVCATATRGGASATITVDDVEDVLEGPGRQSGFAVADAIVAHDPGTALVAARGALDAGEAPLALVGAIAYRIRQLLVLRSGGDGRAAGLGRRPVSGGRLRGLQREARESFGPGELAWAVDRLARLDQDLKGSDLPSELLLEVAIVDLASGREVDPVRPTHLRRPFPTATA